MFRFCIGGTRWAVSLLFPASVVVLLSLDPSGMAGWCIAASAMHEGGHFLMLLLCGGRPALVSVGLFGIRMEPDPGAPLSYRQNLLVSLAGPAVNAAACGILWLLAGGWSVAATVHAALAGLNLLPIEPLDGGQALLCLLAPHMEEARLRRVSLAVSVLTIFPLAAAGFFVLIRSGYNFSLLAVSVYLILLLLFKKK